MTTNQNALTAANGKGTDGASNIHSHYSQGAGPLPNVLARLQHVRKSGEGFCARCPAHDDRHNSLSVNECADGKVLLCCHAGCELPSITTALGLRPKDLFPARPRQHRYQTQPAAAAGGGGQSIPPRTGATAQPPTGVTVEQYAEHKRLPIPFLASIGLTTIYIGGMPAVRIPYGTPDGSPPPCIRRRRALEKTDSGDNRFDWASTPKARLCLYGLDRLEDARRAGYVVIVEGESDCHTLWYQGVPSLGVPGAANWSESRDSPHFDGITTIYAILEPDKGGAAVMRWLGKSAIRDRVRLLDFATVTGHKDPSALHCDAPDAFKTRWAAALETARPFVEVEQEEAEAAKRTAWESARPLASLPNILSAAADAVATAGVVGERRAVKLIYLALTSRFLDRPVSIAVKGPSSAGKSYTTEKTLSFFPPSAYIALTAASERALAYGEDPLSNRFLVIFEAAGMSSDTGTYLIRSLLSEGRLCYETVEKTSDGLKPRRIEREGPTGLITTTTAIRLHPENETRFFSVPVTDTKAQTETIIEHIFDETERDVDRTPWIALQEWLGLSNHQVTIPYGPPLGRLIPATATRLRRDVKALNGLIRAHAILHQASRETDAFGRIIATLKDYGAVRELVADLMAEGAEAAVSDTIRQTVAAVESLLQGQRDSVNKAEVAAALKLDRASGKRRVDDAISAGFLRDENQGKKGVPAQIVLGEPLPDNVDLLPSVDRLHAAMEGGCAVAPVVGDTTAPLSPDAGVRERIQWVVGQPTLWLNGIQRQTGMIVEFPDDCPGHANVRMDASGNVATLALHDLRPLTIAR